MNTVLIVLASSLLHHNIVLALSENNDLYNNDLEKQAANNVIGEDIVASNVVEVGQIRAEPVIQEEVKLTPLPYINNYQRQLKVKQ